MFNSFPIPKPDSVGSFIKNVQRGILTPAATTTNIPISIVDPSKSIVIIEIVSANNTTVPVDQTVTKAKITSSTNLQILVNTLVSSPPEVSWTVIEFVNVKSLQTGQIALPFSSTLSVTISAVNPNKTMVFISYSSNGANANTAINYTYAKSFLSNSTTLQLKSIGSNFIVEWQVIEFP